MTVPFEYFVVFAEMRTGSNLLEHNLNALPHVQCHGEAFNPNFIGYPNKEDLLGLSLSQRVDAPMALLEAVRSAPGMNGFRYFHDHDPRVLTTVLDDPNCAKIILTRNPVDSYVSWKIARKTGQWKLTRIDRRKSARIRFIPAEFQEFAASRRRFYDQIRGELMLRGQAPFYLDYSDLLNLDTLNGLARFLGQEPTLNSVQNTIKRQNPAPLSEKVENFAELQAHIGPGNIGEEALVTTQETERGPAVPAYVACQSAPMLFKPVAGPLTNPITDWMARLDSADEPVLRTGFTQKTLRQWKRQHPGHRSFTAITHPVPRAHWAFRQILTNPDDYPQFRRTLQQLHGSGALPDNWRPDDDPAVYRVGFMAFLDVVRATLMGQTGLRPRPEWGSQSQILQDMSKFASPDLVLRDLDLTSGLSWICTQLGLPTSQPPLVPADSILNSIYDPQIEKAARAAYQRDYMMFGFGPWSDHAA